MVHFTRRRWLSPCRAPGRGTPWKQSWPRLKVEALEDRTLLSTLYALTANNTLLQFDSATPGTITNTATISGLQPGERVAPRVCRCRV